ncbi:MAG: CDF family Co(II)/Ni(II) efflux transporter DmeF [Desulfobulbaceae bacterium]|nr:CDF family Co(II)/Ni(II) efflux transporter DmeF [Desulfobulbaceae bacterium]
MHKYNLTQWQHEHDFAVINELGEQRTRLVLALTAVTMTVEIAAGLLFGSMALLADGWHMGTHVAAFFITIFAYRYARKHAHDPDFTFGTGKVSILGGFASSIALAVVAMVMAIESIQRLYSPEEIYFNQAIIVAVIGLVVNIASAFLLDIKHDHGHSHHGHHDEHSGHNHHHDHNLRAAYFHVLADALTSLLAIVALLSGKYFGWGWLDPTMGIVGAMVITYWAYGLIKETGPVLLDSSVKSDLTTEIKGVIENDADNRIADLHVWKVGANDYAAIISLVTHFPQKTEHYKKLVKHLTWLSHITVEVNLGTGKPCINPEDGTTIEQQPG